MTTFQLDQCLNDASLADDCNARGECIVYRYPKRLYGQDDDRILPVIFDRSTTLLTLDRTIVSDNATSIAAPNPGIIVIQKKKPHPPMTARIARTIIENFKKRVPSWSKIDWSMVYAEIDEEEIYVAPLTDADTSRGQPFQINDDAANTKVTQYLAAIHYDP